MTVKDRVGRPRYVAFRIDGGPLHRQALSGILPPTAKLTRFDGVHGIVRTLHRDREAVQAFLDGLTKLGAREARVVTLATSGTMRKAAEALPEGSGAGRREQPREKRKGAPAPTRGSEKGPGRGGRAG